MSHRDGLARPAILLYVGVTKSYEIIGNLCSAITFGERAQLGAFMNDDGEALIRRICDEIGSGATPCRLSSSGVTSHWAIEIAPTTSFLRAAEVACRNGLGRARVDRNAGGHVLYWTAASVMDAKPATFDLRQAPRAA
jgi:hypothetical protein